MDVGNLPMRRTGSTLEIRHVVMRRIEPTAFVRIDAGPEQMAWFGETGTGVLYGRLAIILFDGKPAVELLEVVCR